MGTVEAIQALNAVLSLAVNAAVSAQQISEVIQKAQAEGRDISKEEWDQIISQADAADARLAEALK